MEMAKSKSKFKKGTCVSWTSKGPAGEKKRKGIVRGFVAPDHEVKLPKSADESKFKAEKVNKIHNRYLIEIPRGENKKTGKKLPSYWLAPKAVTFESTAREVKEPKNW